ncbi:MAG: amidohydrolase [Deltaproteobacteria bacterium]|nr:amidohydrolase [Deltaproteobacteria bacterium]
MAGLDDEEGARLPSQLPPVIDAHVHLFPDRVFEALWRWFAEYGWPVRYKLHAKDVVEFLCSRGVEHVVGLHFAHTPGMAASLNQWMTEFAATESRLVPLATVLPGEPGAADVLRRAFAAGLRGVKLHCHVQAFSVDDDAMSELYAVCIEHDRPMIIHAGREPKSPAYPVDPYEVCDADRVERVLRGFPDLKLCVPHLGADEFREYGKLLERYDGLWLDTTMSMADYFPTDDPAWMLSVRPDRILYGTDFPNIPYAWDRELKQIASVGLSEEAMAALLGGNARELYGAPGLAP